MLVDDLVALVVIGTAYTEHVLLVPLAIGAACSAPCSAQRSVASAISPNERLQHRLHPWTSFLIVPLFALANAGIHLDAELLGDAVTSPITLGIRSPT